MRKVFKLLLLFIFPVIIAMISLEIYIRSIPRSTSKKEAFINENNTTLNVLFLGSSQTERAINPEFIDLPSINLANSAQTLKENFELLKHFQKEMPNLKVVVVEVMYNSLHLENSFSPDILHHANWIDYKVNTFGRKIKPQDYLFFYTNPDYFSTIVLNDLKGVPVQEFNDYGFEINKFDGSFSAESFSLDNLKAKDIYILNNFNINAFQNNTNLLYDLISFCKSKDLEVVVYGPPSHYTYNKLRDKKMLFMRDTVLKNIKKKFPDLKKFLDEENREFNTTEFYNANHLNPNGAKKASININQFLLKKFH